jgi:hypothetical protein
MIGPPDREQSDVSRPVDYLSAENHSLTSLTRDGPLSADDRDRGTPRDATPPTPPGIRVTYHGGSTGLSLDRDMESGEADRVEVAVGQCLLDRRVS